MIKRKLQGWRTRTCLTCALGNRYSNRLCHLCPVAETRSSQSLCKTVTAKRPVPHPYGVGWHKSRAPRATVRHERQRRGRQGTGQKTLKKTRGGRVVPRGKGPRRLRRPAAASLSGWRNKTGDLKSRSCMDEPTLKGTSVEPAIAGKNSPRPAGLGRISEQGRL